MAGLTRKDYVVQVVDQLKENAKACLSGHGLPGAILTTISGRPDILGKLAIFGYSSVYAKKGAKGLKKAANFKISGYKNFTEFNAKARQDVETFMSGLGDADINTFTNENNILTFIVLPDAQTGNTEADIANLKSVAVSFNSSVKKEYKTPGMYITIMWGDSAIAPRDAVKAETKAVVNKRIVDRKTPAKIKAELTAKAKAKLLRLKVDAGKLKANANKTAAELEQFAQIGKTVGVAGQNVKPGEVLSGLKAYTAETKTFLRGLSKLDQKLYKDAVAYKKAGKLRLMHSVLAELSPEVAEKVTGIVRDGNLVTADKMLEARRKQIRAKMAELTSKNAELLTKAEQAPTAKLRANINFAIRKNLETIKLLKAKLNLHKDLTVTTIKNKAKLLAETNAAIDANRAKGMSIQESLNSAIAGLPTDAQQKQQIKQEVIQQLAAGAPLQYAVQQAVQNSQPLQVAAEVTDFDDEFMEEPIEDVFGNLDDETADIASELAGSKTIADILSSL